MTQTQFDTNTSSQRRWLYGFNAAVLVIIALVIVGFIGYFTTKFNVHRDWTSSGLYSLSGSTKNLLKEATAKGETYEIISLFSPSMSRDGEKQRQQVLDILQEYGRASSAVKVSDASEISQEEIERRIRTLYAAELKPYEDTIHSFDKLADDVQAFFKQEAAEIGAMAQKPGTPADTTREAAQLQGAMGYAVPEQIGKIQATIKDLTDSTTPEWTTAADLLKRFVDPMDEQVRTFSDPKGLRTQLSAPMAAYFASAEPRYKDILTKIAAYKERLGKLPTLKVQEILKGIKPDSIVVLGPTAAKVVAPEEIFQYQPAAAEGAEPTTQFNGEQAISSAILSLERPEKVKVVFVSPTAQRLTTGQYSEITKMLQDNNFDVLEWSPPGPPTGAPPSDPNPPAQGKGVVWIVFPPDAPNPQMMMMGMPPPNPQPVIDAAKKHLADGGQAMFLAEAAGQMAMMTGQGNKYVYQDLLTDYGIDVQSKYTVLRQVEGRDPETGQPVRQTIPMFDLDRYSDHAITKSMQSLVIDFRPLGSQGGGSMGMPTVVAIAKSLPKGVDAKVLIATPATDEYWGESSPAQDSVYNKDIDYAPAVPLAVAAVRNSGQPGKEARVVVVGSDVFAMNPFLRARMPVQVGNTIVRVPVFPGNADLFNNSVLWLAGYENMIAVSAKTNAALRIADISPTKLLTIRLVFFFIGAPLAALVLGGIVWFIRRK